MQDRVTVETIVRASREQAFQAYTSPSDIPGWNFASDDWHCPRASVDLREGGAFSSRMEARDGSMGFDFKGIYTRIEAPERIEYAFGERRASALFAERGGGTHVQVSFDPETEHPIAEQRSGWQAILDNFARYVDRRAGER